MRLHEKDVAHTEETCLQQSGKPSDQPGILIQRDKSLCRDRRSSEELRLPQLLRGEQIGIKLSPHRSIVAAPAGAVDIWHSGKCSDAAFSSPG